MNGVFITGSNTNVGKTIVGIEIIKCLSKSRKVKVRKPVETNCQLVGGKYQPKDAIALSKACSEKEPLKKICPYCFELEASPEDASLSAGRPLDLGELVAACRNDVKDDFVVIEGAGGIYSPIAKTSLNSDLAAKLQLPVVIVVRDELGAISQALLTINAAKTKNLTIVCVVLNEINPNNLNNQKNLLQYTKTPIVSFCKDRIDEFYSDIKRLL